VYEDGLVPRVAEVLSELGSERAWVVHGRDGLDELSVFAKSHVAELDQGRIREFEVDPTELGLAHGDRDGVAGSDAAANSKKIQAVLAGEQGAARDIVVLNSGAALVVAGVVRDIREGIGRAAAAIDSGRAREKLAELAAFRG
jgi:anthranilate phosphoribosyltransferase